ncbi:hypothetical protein SLEP1_g46243 [Rubroshorea leprosula]|uniref:Receptor-like serine/threonine-protein kinase n=1 Tax=Rubroshorea leprosula TaxID=152421 RepID=A0AAV5LN56_9ROSI|nr:hypothetical protein SLEP1_g46243 [Rubroshorea leprosula]
MGERLRHSGKELPAALWFILGESTGDSWRGRRRGKRGERERIRKVKKRHNPLLDPFFSNLRLSENGILLLFNESGTRVWSSASSTNSVNSSIAVLEDSGNLVIRDGRNSCVIVWQGFDHPTHTWLPGAKLGLNKLTKERQIYFSWRNPEDPKPGSFSLELDLNGTRQYFIMQNGNRHWNCEIWPGRVSTFGPDTLASNYIDINYVSNEKENYFSCTVTNSSVVARFVMDLSGELQQLIWDDYSQQWRVIWSRPKDHCEIYAFCGEYGSCNQYSLPTCRCLRGFQPSDPKEWNSGNYTRVRNSALQCGQGGKDGFLLVPNIRLLANSKSLSVKTSEECEAAYLRNCSCTGYSSEGECLMWEEDLLNIQYLSFGDNLGRDLHLRLAATELAALRVKKKERSYQIITGAVAGVLSATKNFAEKLGEGGIGCVFRGTLPISVAIAVKRLRCCGEGEKQFLVYDHMPNGSLDNHLFQKDSKALDWETGYNIALGIARGLAYLHEECRDCIIHCDIKPENILLDAWCNPKISDFGLAKLLGRDFSRILTTIKGTRRYLAPERISGEAVTPKADVFSYGMLLFEIIPGGRNWNSGEELYNFFPARAAKNISNGVDVICLLLQTGSQCRQG